MSETARQDSEYIRLSRLIATLVSLQSELWVADKAGHRPQLTNAAQHLLFAIAEIVELRALVSG